MTGKLLTKDKVKLSEVECAPQPPGRPPQVAKSMAVMSKEERKAYLAKQTTNAAGKNTLDATNE